MSKVMSKKVLNMTPINQTKIQGEILNIFLPKIKSKMTTLI